MAHRTSHYPLGKLLLDTLHTSELSILQFVLAIGYRNGTKGIRALDGMLYGGYPNDVFLQRLTSSELSPPPEILRTAIEETMAILNEEERLAAIAQEEAERAAFRPFFQAVPELDRPMSISLFALTGGTSRYTRYLPPSFPSWPLEAQYAHVKQQVSAHFKSAEGRTLFQGRILAYRLFRWYAQPALLFSVEGEPLGSDSADPIPEATLTIGHRSLSQEAAQKLFGVK